MWNLSNIKWKKWIRLPKTRRTLLDDPPPPSLVTDGGEGEAAVVSGVEAEFDCVGGSALSGGTNGVTRDDVRSTTDDDDGGGVGSAVVCSHCYV